MISDRRGNYEEKFLTTGVAEIAKRVNQSAIRHLPQLRKRLVRFQIGIDDLLEHPVGAVDACCRRQDAHSARIALMGRTTSASLFWSAWMYTLEDCSMNSL